MHTNATRYRQVNSFQLRFSLLVLDSCSLHCKSIALFVAALKIDCIYDSLTSGFWNRFIAMRKS